MKELITLPNGEANGGEEADERDMGQYLFEDDLNYLFLILNK